MARGFVEALKRNGAELQKLEQGSADEFLRMLKKLRDELQGRLASLAPNDQTFSAFKINAVLSETETGILQLETQANRIYDKRQQEAVDLAVEHVGDELDRLSHAFDVTPMDVTLDAAKVLADPAQGLLANHFESSVKKYGIDLLNGVRQRIFIGLRTGDQYGKVVRDVAGDRGPFGEVGRSSAERLVRTETSQAYGAAQHSGIVQVARQAPGLKKTWLHIGSYPCKTCGPLHGTDRPVNGTWTITVGKRTYKVAHAPGHPNCTCRVVAMKQSWRAGLQKLGYLQSQDDGERPSL